MLQNHKSSPHWFQNAMRAPHTVAAAFRYRLQAWACLPLRTPPAKVVQSLSEGDDAFRQLSFTFAVIALSARVATADGPLSRDQYIAFRESFPLQGNMCEKIRTLFSLACKDTTPLEHYISQLKYMYPEREELFTSLVERLFRIAAASGEVSKKAEFILADIAHGFSLTANTFMEIRARYDRPVHAYQIMGVRPGVKPSTLKKRYHELMRRYHPDRYGAEELSEEIHLLLRSKTAEITEAYKILAKRAA